MKFVLNFFTLIHISGRNWIALTFYPCYKPNWKISLWQTYQIYNYTYIHIHPLYISYNRLYTLSIDAIFWTQCAKTEFQNLPSIKAGDEETRLDVSLNWLTDISALRHQATTIIWSVLEMETGAGEDICFVMNCFSLCCLFCLVSYKGICFYRKSHSAFAGYFVWNLVLCLYYNKIAIH